MPFLQEKNSNHMTRSVILPLTESTILSLRAGDFILLNGVIYTARDVAHKYLYEMIIKSQQLPFDITNQIIYYCGPTPTPPGKIIGSCGPTTSTRMDTYTPALIKKGLKGMIGKGPRSKEVIEAIVTYKAVYFIACGGAGALLSKKVLSNELVAFPEIASEAVYKLQVVNFPVIVAIDSYGNNLLSYD